ncbi:MAG: cytochrome c [Desulfuromonadaceae bacterium]|nr:cytochrome c [Desulfuromonadaceae bacterium]
MKRRILMATVVASISMMSFASFAAETGETIFKAKCSSCHPDGGNIIKPGESIKGIKDTKKITKKIRKGGGGMPAFDAKTVSDADAKSVADYIVKTFKK